MRNGKETNKCFGPVVVVICGHTFGATTRVSNTIGAASAAGQTMRLAPGHTMLTL